jgi:hypothetical protein
MMTWPGRLTGLAGSGDCSANEKYLEYAHDGPVVEEVIHKTSANNSRCAKNKQDPNKPENIHTSSPHIPDLMSILMIVTVHVFFAQPVEEGANAAIVYSNNQQDYDYIKRTHEYIVTGITYPLKTKWKHSSVLPMMD